MADRSAARIAHVVHGFLPRHRAGTEQHVHALARELANRHPVAIFCGEDDPAGPPESDETCDGLSVRRVRVGPYPGAPLAARALGRFRNLAAERAFARFLDGFQPDLVHVHHLFKLSGGLIHLARRRGIPVVVTLHDYWFICDNAQLLYAGRAPCPGPAGGWRCARCLSSELGAGWARRLAPVAAPLYVYRTHYLRRALAVAGAVIAPSAYVRRRLSVAGARVLPHGIDAGWLAGLKRRPRAGPLRVGYLGTLAPHKGVHLLVAAFRRLPAGQAELHLHGDGSARPDYLRSLQALAAGAAVTFHGPYERSGLGLVLGGLDLVVLPSIWPENAPLTIAEAHLARVPVLAADTGGLGEAVRNGEDGLLFPAGDVDALEAALRRVLAEPGLVERWRSAIRPPKTMPQYAAEVEAIYGELLPECSSGATTLGCRAYLPTSCVQLRAML